MSDEPKTVLLIEVANEFIAEYLVGFLKDSGIPAFVKGANLPDPVAASKRVLGDLTTRVFVHEKDLGEAKKLLELARAEGRLDRDSDKIPEEDD